MSEPLSESGKAFAAKNYGLALLAVKNFAPRRRYPHLSYQDWQDLTQESLSGIVQAVNRWDETRGVSFATYAMWVSRGRITNALQRVKKRQPIIGSCKKLILENSFRKLQHNHDSKRQTLDDFQAKEATSLAWTEEEWEKILGRLSSAQKIVIEMVFRGGLLQRECARQLGLSRGRVGQIMREALEQLREYFPEMEG